MDMAHGTTSRWWRPCRTARAQDNVRMGRHLALKELQGRKDKATRDIAFSFDWNQHTQIEEIAKSELDAKVNAAAPYIVIDTSIKQPFAADEKISKTIADFGIKFPKEPIAIRDEYISAPLVAAHGSLKSIWTAMYPQTLMAAQNQAQRLSQVAMREWLYGLTAQAVVFGTEPESLGTMKIFAAGQLKLLLIAASDLTRIGVGKNLD